MSTAGAAGSTRSSAPRMPRPSTSSMRSGATGSSSAGRSDAGSRCGGSSRRSERPTSSSGCTFRACPIATSCGSSSSFRARSCPPSADPSSRRGSRALGRTIPGMRRNAFFWAILGLALSVGVVATIDRYQLQGRTFPGFWVMENLLVAVGGAERGSLQPFDVVRVMDGQVLTSGRDIQAVAARYTPPTTFHYIVYRRGQLVEADVTSRPFTRRDFARFLVEGVVPGLLLLATGAVVFLIRPGRPPIWL